LQEFIEKLEILSKDSNVVPLICDEELTTILGQKKLEKDKYNGLNKIGGSSELVNNADYCIRIIKINK